jgi:hypothetical protein
MHGITKAAQFLHISSQRADGDVESAGQVGAWPFGPRLEQ